MASKLAGGLGKAIAYQIAADDLSNLVWTVLVYGVTTACQHLHLEASLHLANGKCAIKTINAGQEQLFR